MAFEADEVALVVFRACFELTLFDVSDVLVEVRAVWRVPSRNREGGWSKKWRIANLHSAGSSDGALRRKCPQSELGFPSVYQEQVLITISVKI